MDRPKRGATRKRALLDPGARDAVKAFVRGNEGTLNAMLDTEGLAVEALVDRLEEVMRVNALSVEQVLARFFAREVLARLCEGLKLSAKGSEAILAARLAKAMLVMPAAPPPKKKTTTKMDWRFAVFYWRGVVTLGDGGSATWRGAWVSSTDATPSDAAFEASANDFDLEATGVDSTDLDGLDVAFKGSYSLDNGDGPSRYSDVEHRVAFAGRMCGARGTTEFGDFVSCGRYDKVDQGARTLRLTLARRYIHAGDARIQMTARNVVESLETLDEDAKAHLRLPYRTVR